MLPYPLRQLQAVCSAEPLTPKILLVPRRRAGYNLTASLARHGVNWTQLRVMTVADHAHEQIQVDMAVAGARRPGGDDQWLLMTQVLAAHPAAALRCYGTNSVSTPAALRHTLMDLRLAAVSVQRLVAEGGERLAALADLLADYEKRLVDGQWWDEAHVLQQARQRVDPHQPSRHELLLILDETDVSTLAHAYVTAAAGDRLRRIGRLDYGVEAPASWAYRRLASLPLADPPVPAAPGRRAPTPLARDVVQGDLFLDHLLAPEASASPRSMTDVDVEPGGRLLTTGLTPGDNEHIRLWQATGHESEIRGVLRDLLDRQLPFDEVEIAYPTKHDTYLPLLWDAVCRFDVPAAFVDGLPLRMTAVGRCLRAFFDWVHQGFDGRVLVTALRAGDIPWPNGTGNAPVNDLENGPTDDGPTDDGQIEEPTAAQVTSWLLQGRVGSGRTAVAAALNRAAALQHEPTGADALAVQQRQWQRARDILDRLLSHVPDQPLVDLPGLARGTLSLLEDVKAGFSDDTGVEAICQRLARLTTGSSEQAAIALQAQRLGQRLLASRVMAQSAGPGQIAIAPLAAAGYAGRTHVYVLGLAESHFPSAPTPDPALAEHERIKWTLPCARERGQADIFHLIRLLGVSRFVTLSAHRLALADGREPYPTPLFSLAQRQLATNPVWQRPAWAGAVGCDDLERALSVRRRPGYAEALGAVYPATVQGYQAARARGQGVTRYDGWVGADTWSMERPFSARMLETLAECPRRCLWRDGLRLLVSDEPVTDPRRWLQPVEMGNLLHDLFADFMRQVQGLGEVPSRRHETLMTRLIEAAVARTEEQIPNRLQAAYRNDRHKIEAAAAVFLTSEISRFEQIAGLEIVDLERDFGAGADRIRLQIADWELSLRGRIDRIDRVRREGDDHYEIWDYKTGSTYNFAVDDLLAAGRRLQWALYALALPQVLGRPVRVESSGYFFTSDRGAGQRFAAKPPTLQALADVVRPLLRMAADGLFPALHKGGAGSPCRFCDYRRICRDEAHDGRQLQSQREVMAQWTGLVEGWAETKATGRQQASQVIESRFAAAGICIEDIGPQDAIDQLSDWMSS